MRRNLNTVSLVAVCAFVLSASVALAGDNWIGTWKLDPAKSQFNPPPGPGIETLTWEATPEGTRLTSVGTDAQGKPTKASYVTKYDGKDVAWAGNPDADTSMARKIDDNSYENTWKKGGKVMVTARVVVSKDGKTMTITQVGTNAKGEKIHHVAVYNKQ